MEIHHMMQNLAIWHLLPERGEERKEGGRGEGERVL